MARMFDRIFVYYMDRLVCLIVFLVMANLALEITGVTAQTKDSNSYTEPAPNNVILPEKMFEKDVEVFNENDIKTTPSTSQLPVIQRQQPQTDKSDQIFGSPPARSQLLDNIFNIPIATLQAVNDLVQSIAGSIQAVGSRTYFGGQLQKATTVREKDSV